MYSTSLRRLGAMYAQTTGRSISTIGRLAANHGEFFRRLARGHDITTRRAERVIQWFSDHWPEGADWPADIPRPAPSPDSPPPASLKQGQDDAQGGAPACPSGGGVLSHSDPVAAVRAARARMMSAIGESDWQTAERIEREMVAAALRLAPDGRIASVRALCDALALPRYVYDQVVRSYADGRPRARQRPRRSGDGHPSPTERMFTALVGAGDARFASRRPSQAA